MSRRHKPNRDCGNDELHKIFVLMDGDLQHMIHIITDFSFMYIHFILSIIFLSRTPLISRSYAPVRADEGHTTLAEPQAPVELIRRDRSCMGYTNALRALSRLLPLPAAVCWPGDEGEE